MTEERPFCARHDNQVEMELRSLHSELTRPGELVGLFECPECGFERRLPVGDAA